MFFYFIAISTLHSSLSIIHWNNLHKGSEARHLVAKVLSELLVQALAHLLVPALQGAQCGCLQLQGKAHSALVVPHEPAQARMVNHSALHGLWQIMLFKPVDKFTANRAVNVVCGIADNHNGNLKSCINKSIVQK